ncbi:MAG: hypothetical protein J7K68_06000 [Candidatus Diapherotrites archaeon]|nr:hypothetical protein [Candidatus Diapherotrites archaeon]
MKKQKPLIPDWNVLASLVAGILPFVGFVIAILLIAASFYPIPEDVLFLISWFLVVTFLGIPLIVYFCKL